MVASLTLTGSLALAPAALAGPVDPAAAPVGYGLAHSGHDHSNKADKPKPKKPKKDKKDKKATSTATPPTPAVATTPTAATPATGRRTTKRIAARA